MSASGDINPMVSIALHLLFAALSPKYAVFANSDWIPETVEVSQRSREVRPERRITEKAI
jgi:hypothetical protein